MHTLITLIKCACLIAVIVILARCDNHLKDKYDVPPQYNVR